MTTRIERGVQSNPEILVDERSRAAVVRKIRSAQSIEELHEVVKGIKWKHGNALLLGGMEDDINPGELLSKLRLLQTINRRLGELINAGRIHRE